MAGVGDNLLDHSTLAVIVDNISCEFLGCVSRQPDGACDSFGSIVASASNGSWGVGVNPGGQGSVHDVLLQPQAHSGAGVEGSADTFPMVAVKINVEVD